MPTLFAAFVRTLRVMSRQNEKKSLSELCQQAEIVGPDDPERRSYDWNETELSANGSIAELGSLAPLIAVACLLSTQSAI